MRSAFGGVLLPTIAIESILDGFLLPESLLLKSQANQKNRFLKPYNIQRKYILYTRNEMKRFYYKSQRKLSISLKQSLSEESIQYGTHTQYIHQIHTISKGNTNTKYFHLVRS